MKVEVIEEQCIGCGYCEGTCPEVFEVDEVSKVKVDTVLPQYKDAVTTAIEGCPTEAIKEIN